MPNDADADIGPDAVEVCDTIDRGLDGVSDNGTTCFDDNLDGITEDEGDCNDADIDVNPATPEILGNGVDDDCDGITDDGALDADGDGWTEAASDCDDSDPLVHPGAPELPDGSTIRTATV